MKFQMMYADTFMHNYYACVTNFCDPNSFRDNGMWKQILPEDGVYGSFGCHPKSATDYTDEKEEFLKHIIHHSKVVSLGEIGLDYSRGFDEHRECQKEVFVRQLKIAVQNKMPLVIHCREAEEDCLSLMMEHVPQDHLIHRHCFTGHWYELEPWLAYFSKCYVGLTPLVTFRSAECVHDVARRLPLERLLLETDAPYFRPPYVDKDDMNYSTPGMAICVAHEVARLRGIPMDDVLLKARSNTLAMYGV
ncbi:putative deoxyribonuclease TATDN2 [Lineus longissimus]|uniref:putative deoxyribonuclease TATDN2 n=1 Tax=Lineus longissimus TaxID=88925 RepID=UPI002B4E0460